MSDHGNWRPIAKLMIGGNEKFFGPGGCELLGLIKETGSVRLACERMGMSYSKAWHMLDIIEEETKTPVVIRKKGGAGGGATSLTDAGEQLLTRYEAYASECRAAIQAIFERHFPDETE